jgi:hypothetical protein
MILDNADDAGVLFEQASNPPTKEVSQNNGSNFEPLFAFIPQNPNGSILVKSRNRLAAFKLVGD